MTYLYLMPYIKECKPAMLVDLQFNFKHTDIEKVDFNKRMFITKTGDIHYFRGEAEYNQWCKGRTYVLNGELMHSGYPMHPPNG